VVTSGCVCVCVCVCVCGLLMAFDSTLSYRVTSSPFLLSFKLDAKASLWRSGPIQKCSEVTQAEICADRTEVAAYAHHLQVRYSGGSCHSDHWALQRSLWVSDVLFFSALVVSFISSSLTTWDHMLRVVIETAHIRHTHTHTRARADSDSHIYVSMCAVSMFTFQIINSLLAILHLLVI